MTTPQEKEFAIFGIVNNRLKAGLILGLLTLSITGNIILFGYMITMQANLYEKMINRSDAAARDQADKSLAKPISDIIRVTARADTAISVSIDAAKTADSAGRAILNNQKPILK